MQTRSHQITGLLSATLILAGMLTACSNKEMEDARIAYQTTCEGPPLGTAEARNKALEDGYEINYKYDCISKESYIAIQAANAKALSGKQEETVAASVASAISASAAASKEDDSSAASSAPSYELHAADANTATEAQLADVAGVGPIVALQIIKERDKEPFKNWADLVERVVGLSAAKTAVTASICGLNVNGEHLPGAPPDAAMAAIIYKKMQGK